MITVDSRRRDTLTTEAPKYIAFSGSVIQTKPVREISPDVSKLSPLAKFIVEHADGKYIGGMTLNGFLVRIEGSEGSEFAIEVKEKGLEKAEKLAKIGYLTKSSRAVIKGWQFPVFEPEMDETEYFNLEAERIRIQAGDSGRVIINGDVYNL